MAIDPVCGMEVNETETQDRSSYNGQTYYFCSTDCKEEFDAAPEDYVGGEEETRQTGT
jgi:YHS domain-containing protein